MQNKTFIPNVFMISSAGFIDKFKQNKNKVIDSIECITIT